MTGVSPSSPASSGETPQKPPGVSLRGASLSYAGTRVFNDLNLDLPAERMTCLLGPSGVGKSSLLRYIAGLTGAGSEAAVSGRLMFGGREGPASNIAYLAQQDLLLPWLSVLDNVMLGSRLRGEQPDRKRALGLLTQVGLDAHHGDLPARLSGGMRQRAALARTLMEDRPVVLMDEPFSALDAITRFELQELASELLAGKTTLLVTHDPLEALRIGHRLLLLTGAPALIETPIDPPGDPLRDLGTPELAALQANIMERLTAARQRARSKTATAAEPQT
ncbi:ABC transporter ATP-binding protein [Denitrobaculum tricleocarpae]|nr:ABC transporter ATP-binding protein [Denitrobaculum tricleocarpae]